MSISTPLGSNPSTVPVTESPREKEAMSPTPASRSAYEMASSCGAQPPSGSYATP